MNPWEENDEVIDSIAVANPWEANDDVIDDFGEVNPQDYGQPKSSLFPTRLPMDAQPDESGIDGVAQGFNKGVSTTFDLLNAPSRAAATMRGQEMSDPDAYFFRPETEKYKEGIENALPESAPATKGILKFGTELIGRTVSDPLVVAGPLKFAAGEAYGAIKSGAGEAVNKSIPYLKKGISDLSQIPQELLDRAATKEGMNELSDAARRTGGGNMLPEAQDLAQRLTAQNKARTGLQEGSEARRLTQFEEELQASLNRPDMLGVTPGRGSDIPMRIDAAKPEMQNAFIQGDKASVGPLREKGVSEYEIPIKRNVEIPQPSGPYGEVRPPKIGEVTDIVRKKEVTKGLSEVLREFKALSPEQGVPKITRGASGALKSILGMADKQANSIDDLINLKGQLRSVRSSGGFEGNIFDSSVDDLAFAKAEQVINQNIERSIAKADPKNAGKIIALMRANNEQYAKTKDLLSGLSNSMGRTENSDRVIAKIAALGPKRSQELITSAEKIPALKPVVDELRQGFVDDLILSAQKGGKLDPASFAKRWNDTRTLSPELKRVWLSPEQIKRIDDAVANSAMDIGKPDLLGGKLFGTTKDQLGSSSLAARRMENIGSMANRDAARELEFLDDILGLKGSERFSEQAKDVFQSRQLGMDASGKLPLTPMSQTGRSVLGFGIGDAIGGILGGTLGFMTGGVLGAGAGATIGSGARTATRAGVAFMQSPAGAVAANRVLTRWALGQAEQISPRAVALAKALQKTQNAGLKARIADQLKREIEKQKNEE